MDTLMQKPWTPEEIELVKKMAAEGKSASQIGLEVGRSRNSVIGAAHRNKLQLLAKREPQPKKERAPRPTRGKHQRRRLSSRTKPKAQ